MTNDEGSPNVEARMTKPETRRARYRVRSTEYRVRSTEYTVPSTEYIVPSAEYRVPSTEWGVRNARSNPYLQSRRAGILRHSSFELRHSSFPREGVWPESNRHPLVHSQSCRTATPQTPFVLEFSVFSRGRLVVRCIGSAFASPAASPCLRVPASAPNPHPQSPALHGVPIADGDHPRQCPDQDLNLELLGRSKE